MPFRIPRAWNVNENLKKSSEKVRADEAERGPPEREDHERNRDPAGPARDPVLPLGRDPEGENGRTGSALLARRCCVDPNQGRRSQAFACGRHRAVDRGGAGVLIMRRHALRERAVSAARPPILLLLTCLRPIVFLPARQVVDAATISTMPTQRRRAPAAMHRREVFRRRPRALRRPELPIAIRTLRTNRSRPVRLIEVLEKRAESPRRRVGQVGEPRRTQCIARAQFCLAALASQTCSKDIPQGSHRSRRSDCRSRPEVRAEWDLCARW